MKIRNTKLSDIIPAKEFHVEIYDQYFYVLFGETNLKKLKNLLRDDNINSLNSRGMVIYYGDSGSIYLWFPDREYKRVSEGTLAHEIVHVMDSI